MNMNEYEYNMNLLSTTNLQSSIPKKIALHK